MKVLPSWQFGSRMVRVSKVWARHMWRVWVLVLALLGGLPAAAQDLPASHQVPEERSLQRPEHWIHLTSTYFALYFDPIDETEARGLIAEMDGWYLQVLKEAGQQPRGPITVLMASDPRTFLEMQPARNIEWAVGTAYPDQNVITLKSSRAVGREDYSLRQTTVHEIAHIVLHQAFGDRALPRWLHEGLAMYVSGETVWTTRIRLSQAVLTGSLIPLSELTRRFPGSPARIELAYAQSLEFLSWLEGEHGQGTITRLIGALGGGEELEQAILLLTGTPLGTLEENWHDHLRLNFAWLPALTTGGGLWVAVSALLVVGWWRKKRESTARRARWAVEEERIYGVQPGLHLVPNQSAERWAFVDGSHEEHSRRRHEDEGQEQEEKEPLLVAGGAPGVYRDSAFRHGEEDDDDEERPPSGGWLH